MFRDLMLLGKAVAEKDRCHDILEYLMDDLGGRYKYGLALKFQRNDGEVTFTGVEGNEIGSPNLPKVYYLRGSSPRSEDISPVTKLSEKGPQKRVEDLQKCLQKMTEWSLQKNMKDFSNLCNQIALVLENKKREIGETLEAKIPREVRKKKTITLPTFFYIEVDGQPLSLLNECKDYLRRMAPEKYGRIPKTEISCQLENALCSICQNSSKVLYGNYSEIKCYSLDKPGSIAGGANTSVASKNFPVCPDCAAFIKNGFKYAKQSLSQSIGGESYLLLPKMEIDYLRRRWLDLFEGFQRDVLEKPELKDAEDKERDLLRKIAREFANEVLASYNMVFYKGGGAGSQEWKIVAEIEEVLPSRVAEILKTIEDVENGTPFRHKERDRVNMYLVREFTSSKQRGDAFLEVLEAVFGGQKKISYNTALRWVVEHILEEYKKQAKEGRWTARLPVRGYLFLKFLQDLKVLGGKEVRTVPEEKRRESKYMLFFEQHRDFFDRVEKRVAFLMGNLVATVLYVQEKELGNPKFFEKLRGLRLNEQQLKKIKSESEFKLYQYRDAVRKLTIEHNLKLLLEDISLSWCRTQAKWNISDDEATFCFTLGLNLNYYITQEMGKK